MKRSKLFGSPQRLAAGTACLLLATFSHSPAVMAAELGLNATAGVGSSDNVGRQAGDEIDETIANLGLRLSLDENTPRLFADVVGDLAYYEYLDNTYDSEMLGNIAADVRVTLMPDHLRWLFTDNFGQVLLDPFTPATPLNREDFNYFATGPQAEFNLGGRMLLNLGAQYFMSSYEESPIDSTGLLLHAGLGYALSERSSLGLNARLLDVEYDDASLNGDYGQSEMFLRFDAEGAKTTLVVDAGYAEIDQEIATEKLGDPLLRINLSRRATARSMITFAGGREFSNSGMSYSALQGSGPIGLEEVSGRQTADPFTSTHAALDWSLDAGRTAFLLSGSYRDEAYELRPDFDQRLTSFHAEAQRNLGPNISLVLRASHRDVQFEVPGGDYDELAAMTALDWRLSRVLFLRFSYEYGKRDSELPSANYTENRLWLSFGYERNSPRSRLLNDFERSPRQAESN